MIYYQIKNIVKFSELSKKWVDSEVVGYTYQYEREIKSAVSHLNSKFSEYYITDIKQEDVKIFINERYNFNPNTGKKMSRHMLSDIIDVGSRIFEFAIANDLAYKNPFRYKKKLIPKKATKSTRNALTDEQKNRVLSTEHRAKIAAILMLFCGLRVGELLALEWSDIDFLNKKLSVNKSAERVGNNLYQVTPHTKNGRDRYLPIPDNIIDYLKYEKKKSLSYLVCPKCDGSLQTPSSFNNMWNSYQTEINYKCYCQRQKKENKECKSKYSPTGIPRVIERFTAHQLRHTYCTMLYFAEVDVLTASKLMGHSSVELTLRIYTHLDEKFKTQNISKFNEYTKNFTVSIYDRLH